MSLISCFLYTLQDYLAAEMTTKTHGHGQFFRKMSGFHMEDWLLLLRRTFLVHLTELLEIHVKSFQVATRLGSFSSMSMGCVLLAQNCAS